MFLYDDCTQGDYWGVNAAMYCDMINNNVVLLVFKNDQKPEKCALWLILNNCFSERNIPFFISIIYKHLNFISKLAEFK